MRTIEKLIINARVLLVAVRYGAHQICSERKDTETSRPQSSWKGLMMVGEKTANLAAT